MKNEEKYNKMFELLNERLKKANEKLEIICAGGFVLSYHDIRTTLDIDAFFETNGKVLSIIKEIGEEENANLTDELWLNNSISNLNKKPSKEICKDVWTGSNLVVKIPPLEYVACMKLYAGREQDLVDVATIIKKQGIKSPGKMNRISKEYGFGNIDESVMLETFSEAYGMKWLENYYIEKYESKTRERTKVSDNLCR